MLRIVLCCRFTHTQRPHVKRKAKQWRITWIFIADLKRVFIGYCSGFIHSIIFISKVIIDQIDYFYKFRERDCSVLSIEMDLPYDHHITHATHTYEPAAHTSICPLHSDKSNNHCHCIEVHSQQKRSQNK